MAEGRIVINIEANSQNYRREVEDFEKTVNDFSAKWARIRRQIKSQAREIVGIIRAGIRTWRATLRFFGLTLDPVQEAVVSAVVTSLAGILAIHRMVEAGSMGFSAVATIGLSAASIALSIVAIAEAVRGIEASKQQLARADSLIASWQGLVSQFIGGGLNL